MVQPENGEVPRAAAFPPNALVYPRSGGSLRCMPSTPLGPLVELREFFRPQLIPVVL
jgi:hypothetical protein